MPTHDMPLSAYLVVSTILFTIGVVGVLVRRNPLVIFMSIELMLNAVNLSFVALSSFLDSADGQMFVFLVLTVAAAEVVVGLLLPADEDAPTLREPGQCPLNGLIANDKFCLTRHVCLSLRWRGRGP